MDLSDIEVPRVFVTCKSKLALIKTIGSLIRGTGQLPVERLVSDETKARSRWGYQQMKEKNADMYEKMTRFMEDMRWVPEANTTPIIADQHFSGVPPAFHTLANNSSFFNMATPSNLQIPNQSNWLSPSNWQTPNPSYLGTPNSQPPIPSQPENNRFIILTDPHNIGTLDGSVRLFPSWNDVNWVYMPINAGGVHWVTGAINLTGLIFYVFYSMESKSRMLMLEQQVNN
nr:hypothetical protein [Tanacetum cinerariifolium]